MPIDVGSSFELLTEEEWGAYLAIDIFDRMSIAVDKFDKYASCVFLYPRLKEALEGHNNKIGDLKISYALCRHYFDKGIPDDPWYISPGVNGESIQYVPNFKQEHWMRRYWFNHFAENLYLKFFSVWDGIVEILNIFYGVDETIQDLRFRTKVMKRLKQDQIEIYTFLNNILDDALYKEANKYRTDFVHGFAPSTITDGYLLEKDKTITTPKVVDGKVKMVEKKASAVLTCSVGKYTTTETVMKNIDAFAVYCGNKISELVELMLA